MKTYICFLIIALIGLVSTNPAMAEHETWSDLGVNTPTNSRINQDILLEQNKTTRSTTSGHHYIKEADHLSEPRSGYD